MKMEEQHLPRILQKKSKIVHFMIVILRVLNPCYDDSSHIHYILLENSADPDQLASEEAS